jgi:predicted glycosyltransferase
MSRRPALLCYCQHSVGLGHLTRSYALCAALTDHFRVVLLCGGALPEGIRPPAGVELVALPPLGVGPAGAFVSHDPRYSVEQAWTARLARILAAFRAVRPDVVLVELFPFGRAKFARELVPLLDEARANGALTACSLRDILVSGRADQQSHDDRACSLANDHLDAVLVHSDPRFARLEETFRPRRTLGVPVHYTGFVVRDARRPAAAPAQPGPVVVSAGGGLVGEPLLRAAVEAQRALWPLTGVAMRLIGGPLLPEPEWRRLNELASGQPGLELLRSVPDLGAELRHARASVSQGGYNTALEVVRSGVPGLIVPYATAEEDEQTRRARRLERLGAVRVLDAARLAPAALAGEIERLLAFRPRRARVDLDGARSSGRILAGLLSAPVDAAPVAGVCSA